MNFYSFLRPLLFCLDAETAHGFALAALKSGLLPACQDEDDPILQSTVCGLFFRNPVGLAAGFDKNAEAIDALLGLGFGAVEAGTITPLPQPGNPKPRLFRAVDAEAVINRLGFNSQGIDACLPRLKARPALRKGIFGINIGKNKETTDAASDYITGIQKCASHADYITVNISSPNTPGLRDLQGREHLISLLSQVKAARDALDKKPPVFVKIAPDQTEQQMDDIAEILPAFGIDGVIIGNTTLSRPGNLPPKLALEPGGLSGKPLFDLSTRILSGMHKRLKGKLPLIGCGGISSGETAYAKIRAGASLVQLYSAMVYEGPGLARRVNRELAKLLKRDGFKSVAEAVGANHK